MPRLLHLKRQRTGALSAAEFFHSVGVNVHLTYFDTVYNDIALVKSKLSSLGLKHARDGAHRTADNAWNTQYYSRVSELYADLGVRFQFCYDPRNAGTNPVTSANIDWLHTQSGGSQERLEGPNELDISGRPNWADETRSYQQTLYGQAMASMNAQALPMVAPSLVWNQSFTDVGDLSGYLNFANAHPYPAGLAPGASGFIDNFLLQAAKVAGTKPVSLSESGYHYAFNQTEGHPGVNENVGAKYTNRMLFEYFRRGVKRTHLYELFDVLPHDNVDIQKSFGLCRNDGTERPAFTALKNLLVLFLDTPPVGWGPGNLSYAISGGDADLRKMLFAKSNGKFLLAMWVEKSSWNRSAKNELTVGAQSVTVSFPKSVSSVSFYMPKDSATASATYTDTSSVSVNVPDHVTVLEITP